MEQTTNRFFYDVQANTFAIEQIKTNLLQLVQNDIYAILSKTDWQIVRANDPTSGKQVEPVVLQERQAIRDNAVSITNAINAAETFDKLLQIYVTRLS